MMNEMVHGEKKNALKELIRQMYEKIMEEDDPSSEIVPDLLKAGDGGDMPPESEDEGEYEPDEMGSEDSEEENLQDTVKKFMTKGKDIKVPSKGTALMMSVSAKKPMKKRGF